MLSLSLEAFVHLIMFDLDGTLLRSNTLDVDCFSEAFLSIMGIDRVIDDWADFKYVTDEGIVTEILSKHLNRPATEKEISNIRIKVIDLLKAQAYSNRDHFAPIPGSLEFFHSLTEMKSCRVAIATGCWKESAVLKLSTAGFNSENLIIASCNDSHRREEIMRSAYTRAADFFGVKEFETVTYVGDGVWDIRASRELGYHFIGVDSYKKADELRQEGAAYIVTDFTDTNTFFARLDEIWGSYQPAC
jgi:phosphoglycolate phosphatase-like HAD superfamily hydrolase